MKKILIVLTLLISTLTSARTPESVCMGLTFDSDKNECAKIISSGYISPAAADVCSGLTFDDGVNTCLKAALNKEYTRGQAQLCASSTFDSSSIECMKNSGSQYIVRDVYEVSAKVKLNQIERLARRVKRDIRAGNIVDALTNIIEIIDIATIDNY